MDPEPPKKASTSRARKTTPRPRPKRAAEGKKAATPRRRASPRSVRKDKKETQAAVKEEGEEEEKEQREASKEEEAGEKKKEAVAVPPTVEEVPPAKDTQLRRTYLQRIYRQLQSTHPHQDDGMIRQIATNVEMEACQAATTRSQYVAAMEQEIHKLMQFEIQQANTPQVYANDTQTFDNGQSNAEAQPAVANEMQSGYSQQQISQTQSFEYAQALAKAQSQEQASNGSRSSSFSTPRQAINEDTSFQNLMNSQNSGYARNSMQQHTPSRVMNMQNLQQMGNPFYATSSMVPPTSQSFAQSNIGNVSGQGVPRNMMEAHQQQGNFPMQQQPGSMRTQSRPSSLQEFSAQIQHLDKPVLIELLWNQRNALAYWQSRAKKSEDLAAQQSTASNMGSPGFHSPYNSPMVGGGSFVNANANVEAEMQRARERNNSRIAQHQQHQMPQYSYAQQSNESNVGYSQAGATADWGENPQLYWEKIRLMNASYAEQLRTAQRALAQNTAPPNSLYSVKAQSMMQNIAMVLNILSEQPTNVQPRKFEVLTSIDRFMQVSVTPIVQKVLSCGGMAHMATNSQAMVTSAAVAASVATYSPGIPPSQDSNAGMNHNLRQDSGNQYPGPRYASPSTVFCGVDNSRQSSRGSFADAEVKSSVDGHGNEESESDTQTQMLSGPPDTVKPEYESAEYTSVRTESDDTMATQAEHSAYQYEAPTMTPKESSIPALPAITSRPASIPDPQLSPDGDLSPDGNARDSSSSSKAMQSSSLSDSFNDFSYFPEMDFDDSVPDSSNFVKENNPSNIPRKRGIEDV